MGGGGGPIMPNTSTATWQIENNVYVNLNQLR